MWLVLANQLWAEGTWFLGWNASSPGLSFPSVTRPTDFQTATVLSNSIASLDDAEQRPPTNTQWLWSIAGNRWCCFKPCFGDICYFSIIKHIMTDSTLGIVYQTFNICSQLCSANSVSPTALFFIHFFFREESIYFPKGTLYLDMKTFFLFSISWQCHRKKISPRKLILFLYKVRGSEQRDSVSESYQNM